MTYRQAGERGWQVRKGEKGAIVFFYKKLEVRDRQGDDDERRTIPLLRAYTVFHASQIDGVPNRRAEGRETRPRADRRRRDHREGERRPGRGRRRPGLLRPLERPHSHAAGRGFRESARMGGNNPARIMYRRNCHCWGRGICVGSLMMASQDRADIYARITAEIVAAIEAGTDDYSMPWHHNGAATARPVNSRPAKPIAA